MKLLTKTQERLSKLQSENKDDQMVLRRSNRWAHAITICLIGTAGFGVIWLSTAKTEEIVVARGALQPIGSVRDIQVPVGGVVDKILVKDGQSVVAGQDLILLDTEATKQKLISLQDNLRYTQEQLSLKKLELQRLQAQVADSIQTLESRLKLEKEVLLRYRSLSEQGASAELQYLQQKNRVKEVEGALRDRRLDGLRQEAILKQASQDLNSRLASLRSEETNTRVTLRYQALKSPVNGLIFDLKPANKGYTAQGTETVMKVVPRNALEAKVEIPSNKIGFVRKGMKADLSIDSFPASDFGVLEGTITQIGSDALAPDPAENRSEYLYPSTIQLDNQQLKIKNGRSLPLQVGMSLSANIKLRKTTYLQLLMGRFQDKADSLREL